MNSTDYQNIMINLTTLLKNKRISKKYTVRELALLSNMTSSYISRLENNLIPNPSLKTILNLLDILEISPLEVSKELQKMAPFNGNPSEDLED